MKIKKIFSEENGHDIPATNPSLVISIFHINSNHVRMLLNSVESDWSHLRFFFFGEQRMKIRYPYNIKEILLEQFLFDKN